MMSNKNTLKDLSDFLDQNPNEIETGKETTKEDFINKEPNNLVDVPKLHKDVKSGGLPSSTSFQEIAEYLHDRAAKENKSFAELWLQILEEGAKKDPLLKNTTLLKTMRSIRKTSVNVALEGLSQIIKNK